MGEAQRFVKSPVNSAVVQGTKSTSLNTGVVLSLRRDTSATTATATVDLALKYRDKGVVGLDISGDSTKGDGSDIYPALRRAIAAGFPITLHIGESREESAQQQMKELTELQPKRIGHGVYLCPEALQWIRDHKIPLEMCVASAVKTGMIDDASLHPGLQLHKDGHPIVICTDDPLIFQVSLSEECATVAQLAGLTTADISKLQEQAAAHQL